MRDGQREAEGVKIKKEEKVKDWAKILCQTSLWRDHVVRKPVDLIKEPKYIWILNQLLIIFCIQSRGILMRQAEDKKKKRKNFYWKISFREKHFAVSITKEGRHKLSRDFKMNTTEQNEKAYTKEFWLKSKCWLLYVYCSKKKNNTFGTFYFLFLKMGD